MLSCLWGGDHHQASQNRFLWLWLRYCFCFFSCFFLFFLLFCLLGVFRCFFLLRVCFFVVCFWLGVFCVACFFILFGCVCVCVCVCVCDFGWGGRFSVMERVVCAAFHNSSLKMTNGLSENCTE